MVNSPRTGSFEAIDSETFRAYQLSYSMSFMPGIFCGTQMVTITPRCVYARFYDEVCVCMCVCEGLLGVLYRHLVTDAVKIVFTAAIIRIDLDAYFVVVVQK